MNRNYRIVVTDLRLLGLLRHRQRCEVFQTLPPAAVFASHGDSETRFSPKTKNLISIEVYRG